MVRVSVALGVLVVVGALPCAMAQEPPAKDAPVTAAPSPLPVPPPAPVPVPQTTLAPSPGPELIRRVGTWMVYRADTAPEPSCFALAQARGPAGSGPERLYVTAWPRAGIRAEVSVEFTQPMRSAPPAEITIGTERFTLTIDAQRGYVADPTEELKLLDAMRRGSTLTLRAEAADGPVRATFLLDGISGALALVAQGCR